VECLTFRRHQPSEPFIAAPRQLLLIARDGETRGLFQARIGPWVDRPWSDRPWRARRLDLPADAIPGEVTACAASRTALYVAVRDQGIRRLDLGPEPLPLNEVIEPDPNWHPGPRPVAVGETTPTGVGLPATFTALAVGPVRPDGDSLWEARYAVAGDAAVYRFRADLQPDRRVEAGPAAAGPRPGG
jgi:hypothetical protein